MTFQPQDPHSWDIDKAWSRRKVEYRLEDLSSMYPIDQDLKWHPQYWYATKIECTNADPIPSLTAPAPLERKKLDMRWNKKSSRGITPTIT